MAKYADDVLVLAGCVLILIGVYLVLPVLTWFVAGGMCVGAGLLFGKLKAKAAAAARAEAEKAVTR